MSKYRLNLHGLHMNDYFVVIMWLCCRRNLPLLTTFLWSLQVRTVNNVTTPQTQILPTLYTYFMYLQKLDFEEELLLLLLLHRRMRRPGS